MNKQKIINTVIILIAIIAIAFGSYFYYQLRSLKINPNDVAKKETTDLVAKISKLYLLPVGEDPTIATVSDPQVLKSQSFFTQSEKGDKVLIYSKAGRAILYRPSIDKIIETAPISNNPKTSTVSSPVAPTTVTPATEVKTTTTTKTTTKKP